MSVSETTFEDVLDSWRKLGTKIQEAEQVMNLSFPWSVIGQCIRYPEQGQKLGEALDRFDEAIEDLLLQGILPGPDGEAGVLLLSVWKDMSSRRKAWCDAVSRRPSDRILYELGLIEYVSFTEGPAETDCTLVQPAGPFSTGPTFVETATLLPDRSEAAQSSTREPESHAAPPSPEEEPFLPSKYTTSVAPANDFYSNPDWYLESWKHVIAHIEILANNMHRLEMNADAGYGHLSALLRHLKMIRGYLRVDPKGLEWLSYAELAHTEMKSFSRLRGEDWIPWQPVRGKLLDIRVQFLRSLIARRTMSDGVTISGRSLSRSEEIPARSAVPLTFPDGDRDGSCQDETRPDDVCSGNQFTFVQRETRSGDLRSEYQLTRE